MSYLCEGLAEDLMNALFTVEGLRVLSSTNTFALKDTTTGTREIGTSLGATVVLEGSVQRASERIAVSVRLVNVGDGVTIYSERFQRSAEDAFELQTHIAASVVEGLRGKWGLAGTATPHSEARQRDPTAFALYKAMQNPHDLAASVVRGSPVNMRLLIALECIVALDPSFDRGYAQLIQMYLNADIVKEAAFAKANAVLAQLKSHHPDSPLLWEIDADLEEDMTALTSLCHAIIKRGERMYPYAHPTGLQDIRGAYGRALAHGGLHREAFEYLNLVDRPNEPYAYYNLQHACGCLVAARNFDRALALCRRTWQLNPNTYFVASTFEVVAHLAMGNFDAAQAVQPDQAMWYESFTVPLFHAKQSGTRIEDLTSNAPFYYVTELRGYALLAADDIERGVEHLIRGIEAAGAERRWIGFRLPIFAVLFSDRVKRHAGFRQAVALARLDDASREPIRLQAASLTPITGVEVGPLMGL